MSRTLYQAAAFFAALVALLALLNWVVGFYAAAFHSANDRLVNRLQITDLAQRPTQVRGDTVRTVVRLAPELAREIHDVMPDGSPAVLIPIYAPNDASRPLGLVVLGVANDAEAVRLIDRVRQEVESTLALIEGEAFSAEIGPWEKAFPRLAMLEEPIIVRMDVIAPKDLPAPVEHRQGNEPLLVALMAILVALLASRRARALSAHRARTAARRTASAGNAPRPRSAVELRAMQRFDRIAAQEQIEEALGPRPRGRRFRFGR